MIQGTVRPAGDGIWILSAKIIWLLGEVLETSSTTQKTAADELSYLSDKYSDYSFVAANYTKGMRYGSNATVNVAISPQYLSKMASNPKLEKEYEENIAAMQECDEQNARQVAAGALHMDLKA